MGKPVTVTIPDEIYEKFKQKKTAIAPLLRMIIEQLIEIDIISPSEVSAVTNYVALTSELQKLEFLIRYHQDVLEELTKRKRYIERELKDLEDKIKYVQEYNVLAELYSQLNTIIYEHRFDYDSVKMVAEDIITKIKEKDPEFDLKSHVEKLKKLTMEYWYLGYDLI